MNIKYCCYYVFWECTQYILFKTYQDLNLALKIKLIKLYFSFLVKWLAASEIPLHSEFLLGNLFIYLFYSKFYMPHEPKKENKKQNEKKNKK